MSDEPLRVVASGVLAEYLSNTALWQRLGNAAFAARVAAAPQALGNAPARTSGLPFLQFHAWEPGFVGTSADDARALRLRARAASPVDAPIDAVVERTRDTFVAIQNPVELTAFLQLVRARRPRTVVEIGTARGGTLYALAQIAEPDAVFVSIDLPGAPNCGGQTQVERALFRAFLRPRQRIAFLPRDSHAPATLRDLRRLLGSRAIDLLFLDGDHSYAGVRRDFEMYADLVAPDGLVALHDILLRPEDWGPDVGVSTYWRELASAHEVVELVDPTGVTIPKRERGEHHAWGIGVVTRRRAARSTS